MARARAARQAESASFFNIGISFQQPARITAGAAERSCRLGRHSGSVTDAARIARTLGDRQVREPQKGNKRATSAYTCQAILGRLVVRVEADGLAIGFGGALPRAAALVNDGLVGPGLGVLRVERDGHVEVRSEEHTSELQSRENLVCRLLLEKK